MSWRAHILDSFTPGVGRKTLVADSDGLLRDEHLFRELGERGFAVVHFEDPIAFRFTYESELRRDWDAGGTRELVVVLGPGRDDFDSLPPDVLEGARRLAFHLLDIFPNLSYNVVSRLDRTCFDPLFAAHQHYAKQRLGEAMTKDFVLRHVFEIAPEVIKSESDLLRVLLQRHYRRLEIPEPIDEYLVGILAQRFPDWHLPAILHDRAAFWAFLQERWPFFVHSLDLGSASDECGYTGTALRFPGVLRLPFDHDDIRVYIDNLFLEGILRPVEWNDRVARKLPWVRVGMQDASETRAAERFADLCAALAQSPPSCDAAAPEWLAYVPRLARLVAWHDLDPKHLGESERQRYASLRAQVEESFLAWVGRGYAGLFNHPPVSPSMVHHIPGFLAHRLERRATRRIAFLLIDGLSLSQWHILRDAMASSRLRFDEHALMAWIPTITPVSRQAAFAGKVPGYFADTIHRTDRDESAWRRFWSDRGLAPDEVAFAAVHGNAGDLGEIDAAISHRTRVLAATVFKVDRIMHGIELGAVGMANQVRTWGMEPFPGSLVDDLLARGFEIWLSSDHGNTAATGIGVPQEGVLSDTRGERCRIYSARSLRAKTAAECPGTVCWDHPALPKDCHCLLAPPGRAFAPVGTVVQCHGGISTEEVVVPLVRIAAAEDSY